MNAKPSPRRRAVERVRAVCLSASITRTCPSNRRFAFCASRLGGSGAVGTRHRHNWCMPSDESPPVTASTIRSLYGAAYRCAHPDCRRPLYNVDGESGDRILNSRVAHIHARRRGGPRWIEMPPEENRDFDNLLLLCTQHSYEIDDFPDRFPAEMLREWKAAQILEYDQIHNWPLTDTEAEEVRTLSEGEPVWSTLELVRQVAAVRLTAQRNRTATRTVVTSWQDLRKRTQARFPGWDDEGNDVVVEPATVEVEPIKRRIVATLAVAAEELTPKVEAARVELAAARAAHPQLQPWCDDLGRHLIGLQEVAAEWGGAGPTLTMTMISSRHSPASTRRSVDCSRRHEVRQCPLRNLRLRSRRRKRRTRLPNIGHCCRKDALTTASTIARTTRISAIDSQPRPPTR